MSSAQLCGWLLQPVSTLRTSALQSHLHQIMRPGLDTHECGSPRPLFCTILSPNHISGLFSLGPDLSLPGTKQQSGVDGGYPAESPVRCDKLMANLRRRCCQAGWGGSCSPRDSLWLPRALMWHGNLFQASPGQCLRAPSSPER